jgi:SAM-dependent methyltransferase
LLTNEKQYIWPGVKKYQLKFKPESVIGDFGCGNGRNMNYRPDLDYFGCDISLDLLKICKSKGLDVVEGSVLNLPFCDCIFDSGMCIAVLHHLETMDEMRVAFSEMHRVIKPGGNLMVTIWAQEQPKESKRVFVEGLNLVPWHDCRGKLLCHRRYFIYTKSTWFAFIESLDGWEHKEYVLERGNHQSCFVRI